MGAAIGESLPIAVGVLVSPMPIVALVLMLVSRRAHSNGIAFVAGWVGGIFLLGAVVILLAAGSATHAPAEPATWTSVLKIVLGGLLLGVGVRGWRGRPRDGAPAAVPGWMAALDGFGAVRALGLGALLGAVNPKNLLLVISGATAISTSSASTGQRLVALLVFTAVASLGVLAPLGIYLAMDERAARLLDAIKEWMIANNAVVMAVLLLVLGVKVLGAGIASL